MSEFFNAQEAVVDHIRSIGLREKFATYDGSLPTGEELKSTRGRYWPYVVFALGGKSEVANRHKGIDTSAADVKWTSVVFYCVGDTPRAVRRLKDVLRVEFEGYEPVPGWGQLTEVLTGDFGISKPDPDLIPLRYGETLAFKAMTAI